jgi:hypothetical protein
MEDHVRELLNRYQYCKEVKETVAFCVLFGGEDAKPIMKELGIHAIQTVRHWVVSYQQQIEQGLIYMPTMNEKQKYTLEA